MGTEHVAGTSEPRGLPFVAPCNRLEPAAPWRWLRLGWADVKSAPIPSIAYGFVVVALCWVVSLLVLEYGSLVLLLSMLSGFVFIGPVIATGLYEIARQVERGEKPLIREAWRGTRRALANTMVFALALLVVFLVWARAASMISIFLPVESGATPAEFVTYFGIGTAIGAIFAAVTFAASAFSLPMIDDRETDTVTALITSVNAVLRNKRAMVVWATIIVVSVLAGFATAFLAFWLLIPLLGYATRHAYEETIDASAWPRSGR